MKYFRYIIAFVLCTFIFTCCSDSTYKGLVRKKSFNEGWSFHYGNIENVHLTGLDETQWQKVDLPHDWSVEMSFTKSEGGIAIGQTQGGTAWYRKAFVIPQEDKGKLHNLYFEGVYMESEVWINGKQVSYYPYGYTSFWCDISKYCNPPGEENIVAVKVKNEGKNSRWYAGSGIYRHVWLVSTDRLHLDEWETFISTGNVSDNAADIHLDFNINNKSDELQHTTAYISIINNSNQIIGEKEVILELQPSEVKNIKEQIQITNPSLWSVDSPSLYTAKIKVESSEKLKDEIAIPFGIRSISFSAKEGFLLNGKSLKLKGGCVHHDNGLLGAAAFDRAEEKKVELLKANGFNAVRCAHNPPSEKFLEACDRLGILVINESFDQWQKQKNPNDYHRFFDEWHEKDMMSMVLRDRNHPSIIMWSIGNEIQERSDSSGVRIARQLREIVRKYDTTRPVTAAINDYWDNPQLKWNASPAAFATLDVGGYNYMWWEYENDAKNFPERVIYGSETTAMERTVNWDLVEKYPSIIGDFIWTAIDYLGESGIGHALSVKDGEKEPPQFLDWPWFNGWCGDIDICGYKKPQSLLRDVLWNESKIEMLVHKPIPDGYKEKVSYWGWPDNEPHWNWGGYEGQLMDVVVYTRYPSVRLYLNGKQLEEKETETKDRMDRYAARFKVKYEPGILKAVGVSMGGEKESAILTTTGEPVKIRLKADRTDLKDSKNDLSYVQIELIDKDGNIIPDKDLKLELSISGKGRILAAGNACPTDMESFRSLTPKTYKGRALAIIQPEGGKGDMTFKVKTQYGEESVKINVK